MWKIKTFLRPFLRLRPNCLLTRKPVRIESSTRVHNDGLLSFPQFRWFRQKIYQWQIVRHGYKMASFDDQAVHVIDVDQIHFSNLLDYLIACAERDYLETDEEDFDKL
jgi:hypothetical protein